MLETTKHLRFCAANKMQTIKQLDVWVIGMLTFIMVILFLSFCLHNLSDLHEWFYTALMPRVEQRTQTM